ncbi:long-chain fatty acid--CoA ligase [Fictibacillus enclensis]|uniref:long-chain fatty acid--CoA ligase n=1 Tax=Fictibacillus enclensis TaxID=1017270 RepID=UPI0025A236A7|nr:long-chain fatty acid--CoA ligase [Fictibacillus enclensis]MDM5199218.1 long-chain fatty acid--CoA ligase [Fictibacillus enclensis]
MNTSHYPYWPKRISKTLTVPETTLYDNLLVSARRYPKKTALSFYGASMTYEKLLQQVDRIAGYLQQELNVRQGDRVMLFMQNSPQYIISCYAIMRAGAVVVPLNPMNTVHELEFYIKDCKIAAGIVSQELYPQIQPLLSGISLQQILIGAYSDYLSSERISHHVPDSVLESRHPVNRKNHHCWQEALDREIPPSDYEGHADDIVCLPYTSGTTGLPKGCVHTNRTIQANVTGAVNWMNTMSDSIHLATLPLFHVTGMLHSMHAPIFAGSQIAVLTRWDRNAAAETIQSESVSHWVSISTMVIDFLSHPDLMDYNFSSLSSIAGGGAALPKAVGEKLCQLLGVKFVEGYGLSETISHTHFNPPDRPKLQCLGIPSFDVDARIVDPASLKELGVGEIGEIVVAGPQVFLEYYNRPEETKQAFFEKDGKRFFRTGDIGRFDEEGYYFMVDRVKRMINASGFKVWPTEVEFLLYDHSAVLQACVVGIPDPKRGETVKAFIILKEEHKGKITEQEIIDWSKEQMAAYKYPRTIEFRESFPTTASGKILWRKLQEEEKSKRESISASK